MSDKIANVEYTSTMIDIRDESTNYLVGKIFEVNYFVLSKIQFRIYLCKDNLDCIEIKQNHDKDILRIVSTNNNNNYLEDIFDELCSYRMVLIIIDMILSLIYSKGDLSDYVKLIEDELSEKGYESFKINIE